MPLTAPENRVVECPRPRRAAAIRRLHDTLPVDQRAVLAQVLDQLDPADEAAWAGLLIALGGASVGAASESAAIDGVIWVQRAPGNTAVLWASAGDGEVAGALLRAAATFVDARCIPLAQMVVGEHDGYCARLIERSGFPKFAGLLYLFAEVSPIPGASNSLKRDDLQFVVRACDQPQRLGSLLEQTYLGTLDCPALDGVRPMDEVLEGYRNQGRYTPEDWYFVQRGGSDVGVLILTEHPSSGNWELVYMGVVPGVRGQRRGDEIVRFALDVAARRGAERLVLAVDEKNAPALRCYERAGFVVWDRRRVYARLRSPAQPSADVALPPSR